MTIRRNIALFLDPSLGAEIRQLTGKVDTMQAIRAALLDQIESKNYELLALRQSLKTSEDKLSCTKDSLASLEQSLVAKTTDIIELRNRYDRFAAESTLTVEAKDRLINTLETCRVTLETEIANVCAEREELTLQLEEGRGAIAALTEKVERLQREEVERLQRDLDKAPTELPDRGNAPYMPFTLGSITAKIYGGPFRECPDNFDVNVKMAVEIKKDCLIDIPTRDFDVPNSETLRLGLLKAILHLKTHGELYVGCMGGIGRTGLFMAALAKIMKEAGEPLWAAHVAAEVAHEDPILYVRDHYCTHAVETADQKKFIKNLKVDDLVAAAKSIAS